MNKMKYFFKNNLKKIFLSTVWLSFFFCINLNPSEFNNFSLINKIRILIPLLLIFFAILAIKDIKYKKLLDIDSISFILIFILYSIFNILNKENDLSNLFWPLYMFLAYFFITSVVNDSLRLELIKLSIFILLLAFFFYFSLAIMDMIEKKKYPLLWNYGKCFRL